MDLVSVLLYALIALIVSVVLVVAYARWNYGTLEAMGIPVVSRSAIMGSTRNFHGEVQHLEDIERFKKYGPVYGVYFGRTPQIHISDPELVELMFVKDFNHFNSRLPVELGDAVFNEATDFLIGDKWKKVRGIMSKLYTIGNIKRMSAQIDSLLDFHISQHAGPILEGEGSIFNARTFFGEITVASLGSPLFGLADDLSVEQCQRLAKVMSDGLHEHDDVTLIHSLALTFPVLGKFAALIQHEPTAVLCSLFRDSMLKRISGGKRPAWNDVLEPMMQMMKELGSSEFKDLGIGEMTALAQGVVNLVAAYDPVTSVLSFTSYYLARNPEKQALLHAAIDAYVGEDEIVRIPYLAAVVQESLRMCPPFFRPERVCTKDWAGPNGLKIRKGLPVVVPAWALHRNPKAFPDPDTFLPERFLNKEKQVAGAYIAFGNGPRSCQAYRVVFQYLERTLYQVLKKYRLEACEKTEAKFKTGRSFLIQYEPVYLKLVKRG